MEKKETSLALIPTHALVGHAEKAKAQADRAKRHSDLGACAALGGVGMFFGAAYISGLIAIPVGVSILAFGGLAIMIVGSVMGSGIAAKHYLRAMDQHDSILDEHAKRLRLADATGRDAASKSGGVKTGQERLPPFNPPYRYRFHEGHFIDRIPVCPTHAIGL